MSPTIEREKERNRTRGVTSLAKSISIILFSFILFSIYSVGKSVTLCDTRRDRVT